MAESIADLCGLEHSPQSCLGNSPASLYTIWNSGGASERAFAVIHCTLGDGVIATIALLCSLMLLGRAGWPRERMLAVAALTIVIGFGYTGYSEYLNVYVRRSWAYADVMPVVQLFGWQIGAAPLAQWVVVPTLNFLILTRWSRRPGAVSAKVAAPRRSRP